LRRGLVAKCFIAVVRLGPALAAAMTGTTAFTATAEIDSTIVRRFETLSLSVPTTAGVIICHGFGCKFRTQIGLSRADYAHFSQLMSLGRASAEAERRAVAQTIAWFEKRVAPEAGTAKARAKATIVGDSGQFDCVDASTNTTSLLLVLQQLGLLTHHRVQAPVSRGLGFHTIHTTAVLRDVHSQVDWVFDPWTRNNGELPEVMPLAKWLDG
jgi:hypothetical protein